MLVPLDYLYFAVLMYLLLYCVLRGQNASAFRKISVCTFVIYLLCVLYFTVWSRTPKAAQECDMRLFWTYRYALIYNAWDLFYEAILNVGLFVPFGLLVHGSIRDWKWYDHLVCVLLPAAVLSAGIEMIQFQAVLGVCELDDVMHNTLGALIGSSLYESFRGLVWKQDYWVVRWKNVAKGLILPGSVAVVFLVFDRMMRLYAGRI